jgi:DNA-binding response OmpR family regulator
VEDDILVRMTLTDGLEDAGFSVVEAGDAQEALSLLASRSDILALMTDINLPGGADGFTLARAARVVRPELPVVYASGRYMTAEEGRSVPGSCFLAKPFTPSLAAAAIRATMRGEAPPRLVCASVSDLHSGA